MRRIGTFFTILLAFLIAFPLSAAVLRTGSGGQVKTLDPVRADDLASRDLTALVYDTLLQYDYTARPYKLIPSMLTKMPDVSADTETYRDVLDAVKGKGLQVQHPVPGDVLDFNGLPVEIFGPVKEYSNLNNHSIVLRVSVGETAFLFTGDVEIEGEYDILEQGFDISADVLKVSHHGSSGSSVEEFLAYTDADYAVISVGEGQYL